MDFESIEEKILAYIKSRGEEPTATNDIIYALKISYPTITKYLLVLEAKGKIRVSDQGNIKYYYAVQNA